jgi:MFS family permease
MRTTTTGRPADSIGGMATTSSAIGQVGIQNDRRHLGAALLLIAAAQLMVVLDATIVIVAQPHIQKALGFSGSGLEWVVNAYALTFGGLLAGGLLVTYATWRWVLFVNVPIGIGVALGALVVLPGTTRRPGRLDLPGAITGTGGIAALVYGLSSVVSPDGTSHWGDGKRPTPARWRPASTVPSSSPPGSHCSSWSSRLP